MSGNLIAIIVILVLLLVLAGIIYYAYCNIRKKLRDTSRMLFGTDSMIEGMKQREKEVEMTPKSVSSATNLYMPSIMRDFPEFHYDEMKSRAENVLTSYLQSITKQNPALLSEGTRELKEQLRLRLEMLQNQSQKESFENIHIHRTEIHQYRKQRGRQNTVAGIYQTNFSAYDDLFLITDLYTVNRLNSWQKGQVSGIELEVNEYSRLESVKEEIRARVDTQVDAYGGTYYTQSVEEVNPQIFAWLDLLDMNVWVILFLMTGVAGFTMISGLLIIILERTNMIGVLKALGADNFAIRKIFLSFSVFLIGRGMVWGNIIGVALCFIQSQFHLFKLDPATYYVDRVPIEFNIWIYLLLNVCTLLVSVLMLVGPSFLVTRIHPAKSIRFE